MHVCAVLYGFYQWRHFKSQVGHLGHFKHISTTTPIAPALKNCRAYSFLEAL
jgi:hypothetical protein